MHIVTHHGAAHRDEFLACCLLLAHDRNIQSIHRRAPTPDDEGHYIVDVGMEHDPARLRFDHHQFERDHEPCCSLTLVAEHIGLDLAMCRKLFPWWEFAEWIDSKGPYQTAAHFGMSPEALMATVSPVEGYLLFEFAEWECIRSIDYLFSIMHDLGTNLLTHYKCTAERVVEIARNCKWVEVNGMRCLDNTWAADRPALGVELFLDGVDCPVTITCDDRDVGLCLYRRNDDPRFDLSRIDGQPGVRFAHKNGFIAKLEPGADVVALLEQACVSAEERAAV